MSSQSPVHDGAVSLLCLHYTQQLLPALAALLQYRAQRGQPLEGKTLAFVWCSPHTTNERYARRRAAFDALLAGFPWVQLWMPEPHEVRRNLSHRVRALSKIAYFKGKLGSQGVSEIVYAHDLCSDFTPQTMMQTFPDAAGICFGDGLGIVYTNAYFESMLLPLGTPARWLKRPRHYILNALKRLHRVWLLPRACYRREGQYAALILACDPGGDFLPSKELVAVSRTTVKDVLARQMVGVDALPARHALPRRKADRAEAVVQLGSYTESKLCSLDMELGLYRESLAQWLKKGDRVLFKPHPASAQSKIEHIATALSKEYDVAIVDPSLYEVPIEAMPWLYEGRQVVSYSYSSVSLTYLGCADVVHALTDDLINRHLFEEVHAWMHESNQLYLELRDTVSAMGSGADAYIR